MLGETLEALEIFNQALKAAEAKIERLIKVGDALTRASESGINLQLIEQWEAAKND